MSTRRRRAGPVSRRRFLALVGAGALGLGAAHAASPARSRRWSDPGTWAGSVPGEADVAVISGRVVLDTDARVAGVLVRPGASLVFDPHLDLTLESAGNVVVRGRLRMRPADPSRLHRLAFPTVDEGRFVGGGVDVLEADVGLWVMGRGVLDLAGAAKRAWTTAAGAVPAGTTAVELARDPAGWAVGDEVVLTPTGGPWARDHHAAFDGATVVAISGRTITLSRPTAFDHPAVAVGRDIVHTAEVLNLTRNVRIEGSPGGRTHVFIRSSRPQLIRRVAIRHVGPRLPDGAGSTAPVLGRYGLHFHHCRAGSRGSLVQGVVIRDCGSHAFVPHVSHGITFKDCIAYRGQEAMYWWDDRDLTHDTLYERCVGAGLSPARPAGVFVAQAGSGNAMVGCVAVGNAGPDVSSGFAWRSTANHTGSVWRFEDCLAHNNRANGIFVWQIDKPTHPIVRPVIYHCGKYGIMHGSYQNRYRYEDGAVYACGLGGAIITATSNADHPDFGPRQGWTGMLFDQAGLSPYCVETSGHVLPAAAPILMERCEFRGATRAALAAITPSRTIPDTLDVLDCAFEGNEFWVGDAVPAGSFIHVRDALHGDLTLRRKDQPGQLRAEWNARVTPG